MNIVSEKKIIYIYIHIIHVLYIHGNIWYIQKQYDHIWYNMGKWLVNALVSYLVSIIYI